MDINQYLELSYEDQWEAIFNRGKPITSFESVDCKYILYAISNFFVDIELCPIEGTIIGKSAFIKGPKLEKYLNEKRELLRLYFPC